ncbi:PREDICTED: protein RALF-like 22 [Camelina sativa]|uniref:Protein RALF-like 22 n=1 Tax=Camelina sativa TaxID=90675 RepID=A0ABM0TL58_CAMSA|nr:PREDICTED: protein RALF-like 22 [Camelina sativa]
MNTRAIYAVIAILAIVISAVESSGDFVDSLDFVRTAAGGSSSSSSSLFSGGCKGSIAECIAEEEEMEFDSDISRRILAQKKYVSYGAMRKNSVPCSRRGASYYNCQRGAQANPYRRGCSAITRCRR